MATPARCWRTSAGLAGSSERFADRRQDRPGRPGRRPRGDHGDAGRGRPQAYRRVSRSRRSGPRPRPGSGRRRPPSSPRPVPGGRHDREADDGQGRGPRAGGGRGRCRTATVVDVEANGVTLKGFTVQGATGGSARSRSRSTSPGSRAGRPGAWFCGTPATPSTGSTCSGPGRSRCAGAWLTASPTQGSTSGASAPGRSRWRAISRTGASGGSSSRTRRPAPWPWSTTVWTGTGPASSSTVATGCWSGATSVSGNHEYGIHVALGSDANSLFENLVSGSGILDVLDEGAGNCWNGTGHGTASPRPPPTC